MYKKGSQTDVSEAVSNGAMLRMAAKSPPALNEECENPSGYAFFFSVAKYNHMRATSGRPAAQQRPAQKQKDERHASGKAAKRLHSDSQHC